MTHCYMRQLQLLSGYPLDMTPEDSSKSEMQAAVRQAVADGIREALADKEVVSAFWAGAVDALHSQAKVATGSFILGSLRKAMSSVSLWLIIFAFVYSVGGWGAVIGSLKALWAHPR